MYLRSLKLRGFKSFPDAFELRLEPGVAIVVGPNGSGKSNVADAIRWAAGSLSPYELRAEKPDDVLYSGSPHRPAAEHCEVELLFDNEDGSGAVEWSELSIARRLQRGSEGQYLVNRTPVRRLDVVELLADLGLGGDLHSVIGQGKVEQILASKPADRRALVEEAAGLGRFKRRRHRAELKLARVQVQVDRARDLEEEVRKRLRPLALQASAAERAEKLSREIEALKARIATGELVALEERLVAAGARRETAEHARRAGREKLEAILAERERAEEELADAAGRREEATAALYRLRSAAERLEMRREAGESLAARLASELAAAEEASASPSPELDRLRRAAATAANAARAAARAHERALVRLRPVLAARANEAGERLETALASRRAAEAGLAEATAAREAASATLLRLGAAAERAAIRREGVEGLLAQLEPDLAAARQAAARAGPSPADLEHAANEALAQARAAWLERDELADRARSARERLSALERSLAEREGIAPAARALAEAGERLVLSLLEVEEGAERAVAAALAHRASALVARDSEAAFALVERARAQGLGSLTAVVSSSRAGATPPTASARPLAELVSGAPEAVSLLAGVWLVPLEHLLEATDGVAVTDEGHAFDSERGELSFAGETPEALLLELESRRRALEAETRELAARAARAVEAADGVAASAAEAEAAYAQVAHLRARPPADPVALGRLVDAAELLDAALAAAAGAAARLEGPLRAREQDAAAAVGGLSAETERLSASEQELREGAAASAERVAAVDVELARIGVAVPAAADAAGKLEELVVAAEAAASVARQAAERAAAADRELARAAPAHWPVGDPAHLAALAGAAGRLDAALLAAASGAARFEAPLRARADAGVVRTGELAAELRRLGAEEAGLRRAATEAAESVAAIEVEVARLEAEVVEVRRRLESLPAVGGELGSEDPAELAFRRERLERRREQLGQVNPLAKEDYEGEKERLSELSEQRGDLEASLGELERLRAELTETVERRFEETYAAVERHFADVAATLFPGGRGRLALTADEDGGEPGIEIELQPAGKRITRLSLLSGGEKALGAISFVFALFLARPCPFYLLDEVEAALDDANIGRFVELLRRFSEHAQFIVVTHQKATMEAADILYGVTMGPDGVSQVVSKRLAREQAHARSA